ncbi:PhzF family phenazine biosynthesis protein [Ketobacter sp.]|uniref:PhzF family phenazine biosynthesis protein n=1 Tax=Ketobacter sp. TaxID=2083498 RepID=UPI000F143495|nr:PhzF family phenazine biosynthesis isomerase [Ketobacter sp.]RLT93969.1 MAG: PhzF family phenazine biosynthesis protein [Ketobacter sp.]
MNIHYRLYDVFAETPFAGTQIAVVTADATLDEPLKMQIASEFGYAETVFYDPTRGDKPFSVYNEQGKTTFGAHTTLAAAQRAFELGLGQPAQGYATYTLRDGDQSVDTYQDSNSADDRLTLYARHFDFTTDRFVPELSRIAEALNIDVKHLAYSRYKPRLVSVDSPVLVVPVTRPEHILGARLNTGLWSTLLAEIYAHAMLLVAPGSMDGGADFHGRLITPKQEAAACPPIGSVIPEFIAYLCCQENTASGTHIASIERGGHNSRRSLIQVEFDFRGGNQAKCRVGGKVILMAEGRFT